MARTFFKTVKNSVKYWWLSLIIGLIFIAAGVFSFIFPAGAYESLAIIFSISFLVSGIFEIAFAISNKDELDHWGWTLAYGLLTAAIGFFLIANPILSLEVLAYYVGFLVLFRAISGFSYAFELKNYGSSDWGVTLFFSILATIFAFIILSAPQLAGLTAVIWVGMALFIIGFIAIYISFQLKKIKDLKNNIPDELREKYDRIKQEIEEFEGRK
jgi:uncharacterized membrane protein HdeD (DUF308 family)